MSYIDEQEQVELIKNWWKKYGNRVLGLLALAILALGAWQFWQSRKLVQEQNASSYYQNFLITSLANNPALAKTYADSLFEHYPNSLYTQLASLMLAKQAVEDKDLKAAKTHLTWVVSHSKDKNDIIYSVANLRLARIALAEGKPKTALAYLADVSEILAPMRSLVAGDVYLALHETEKAKAAWQETLKTLPESAPMRSLIELKLYSLPASNT